MTLFVILFEIWCSMKRHASRPAFLNSAILRWVGFSCQKSPANITPNAPGSLSPHILKLTKLRNIVLKENSTAQQVSNLG